MSPLSKRASARPATARVKQNPISTPPAPHFTIEPVTSEDISTLATIYDAAFATDSLFGKFLHSCTPAARHDYNAAWLSSALLQAAWTGNRLFKAVSTATATADPQIVGFAYWVFPHIPTPEQFQLKFAYQDACAAEKSDVSSPPDGANVPLMKFVDKEMTTQRRIHYKSTKDFHLWTLAVTPEWQGRGIAKGLMKVGVEEADRQGASCYLEASPMGLPIYKKMGWEVVDEIRVDLKEFGAGEGVVVRKNMVRKAGGVKAEVRRRRRCCACDRK